MEEAKRASYNSQSDYIPTYPVARASSSQMRHTQYSNSSLGFMPGSTGLNNQLGQGVIAAQIGNSASELMKI